MKKSFFVILSLLSVFVLRAQDRIYTTDGRIIECRIADFQREDGAVVYYTPDLETNRMILAPGVDYIEIGGTKMVRDQNRRFQLANERYSVHAPQGRHLFGATGGYLSEFWSAGVSYTWLVSSGNGIGADLLYGQCNDFDSRFIQFLPHYESRTYIQRMGSFFVFQPAAGVSYYRTPVLLTKTKHIELGTLGFAFNLNLGLDIRLCKGLYLNLYGRIHWEPWAWDVSGAPDNFYVHIHHAFGFMAGLRFGPEH